MKKVVFVIKYEVLEEKIFEFLDVARELKNLVKADGLESYSIFSVKGKKNEYQEIYKFESAKAYDNYDDAADERTDALMTKLADLVKPHTTKYSTLTEI